MDSQTSDYQKLIQILQSDRNTVDQRPSLRKSALIDLIISALQGIEQGTFSSEIETLIPNEHEVQITTGGQGGAQRGRGTGQVRGGIVRATSFPHQPTGQASPGTPIPFQRGGPGSLGPQLRGGPRGPQGNVRGGGGQPALVPLKLQALGPAGSLNSPRYTQNLSGSGSQNSTPREQPIQEATSEPEPSPQADADHTPTEDPVDVDLDSATEVDPQTQTQDDASNQEPVDGQTDEQTTTTTPSAAVEDEAVGHGETSLPTLPTPPSPSLGRVNPFSSESDDTLQDSTAQDALREELYGSNNLYHAEDDIDTLEVGDLTVDIPGIPKLQSNEYIWTTAKKGPGGSNPVLRGGGSPVRSKLSRSASEAPPRPQPAAPEDLKKLYEKRNTIIQELLTTEQTYLCNLIILKDVFIKPLADCTVIPEQTYQMIFSPQVLFQITTISEQFCFALSEETTLRRDLAMIGPLICSFAAKFKVYGKFINAFEASQATLHSTVKKNAEFQKFIKTAQRSNRCQGHTLEDFLIQVVQRLPRYVLLLSDIEKATPRMHPDYNDTKTALEQMKSVTDYVNNEKRRYESWIKSKSLHIQYALQADWHAQKFFGCEHEIFKNPPTPAGTTPRVEPKLKNYKIIVFNDIVWMVSTLKNPSKGDSPTVLKLGLKTLEKVDALSFKLGARIYYSNSEDVVTNIFETQQRFLTGPENIKLLVNKKDRTKSMMFK